METLHFSSDISVRYGTQVLVVGAGPGGIAAAVTAARRGAEVLLIESSYVPGGQSTAGGVPVFMPYSDGERVLCGGFGAEVLGALSRRAAGHGFRFSGAIHSEHLKSVYEDLLEQAGVTLLYGCRLCAVQTEGRSVTAAVFASSEGLFAVRAEIFIDGTGDGLLAGFAGAEYASGGEHGEYMPVSLCSLWGGFDWEAYCRGGAFSHNDEKMPELLEQAIAAGELSQADFHHTGLNRNSNLTAAGNIGHEFGVDPYQVESYSRALVKARRRLREYEQFYRKYIPGFSQAEIISSAGMLGTREGRRIIGDYILNYNDFLARAEFPDEIGRYNFPADIHPSNPGRKELEEHKKLFRAGSMKRGESYGIPYRILLPRKFDNMMTCGRCVSTDRRMFASIRVIPGCYITGQAAGLGAAGALAEHCFPRQIDIQKLRSDLRGLGVYLR